MAGAKVRVSIAVVPMLAPDSEARMVPEPTASSARRPGTEPSQLSSASIILVTRPVRNRISPCRMNIVIGSRTKTDRLP